MKRADVQTNAFTFKDSMINLQWQLKINYLKERFR